MLKALRLPSHIRWWYIIVAIIPAIAGAGNFVAAKIVVENIPPITLNLLRWLVALAFLLPFTLTSVVTERKIIFSNIKILSLIGLFGITLFNSAIYTASHYTMAINLGMLANIFPVFVLVIAHFFLKEKAGLIHVIATLLCLFGSYIIIGKGEVPNSSSIMGNPGDYLALLAALIWALYSVSIRYKPQNLSFPSFVTSTVLLGTIFIVPLWIWEVSTHDINLIFNLETILAILYLGLFVSVIGLLCYNFSILKLGANLTSVIFYLSPIFNIMLSQYILGEEFTRFHLFGVIMILVGINMTTIHKILTSKVA